MDGRKVGVLAATLLSVSALIGIFFVNPIAQDPGYHSFSDQRTLLEVPNFWNVMSNLPFLLVGMLGLYRLVRSASLNTINELKPAYALFFAAVAWVALGSAYYHWTPNNISLVWDRLPMTVAFMALFSIIIGEYSSVTVGKKVLWPLVLIGVISVFYWFATERQGAGDLRLYALVQFLPMLLIPIVLVSGDSRYDSAWGYWALLGAYVIAKVLEHFDTIIFGEHHFISGHSLKHVAAAFGIMLLLDYYSRRTFVSTIRCLAQTTSNIKTAIDT